MITNNFFGQKEVYNDILADLPKNGDTGVTN